MGHNKESGVIKWVMSEILANNPIFEKLISLKLLPEDYAVFGSGPMFAHGIKG